MAARLRILYVGPLWEGGTCLQRMNALIELGHYIKGIDTEPPHVRRAQRRLWNRIAGKLFRMGLNAFGPRDLAGANRTILEHFRAERWDVLWLDKGLTIEATTLQEVKGRNPDCRNLGYSPDDMFARHNQSRQFLEHIRLSDVFFTTKSYGVRELESLGCPRVVFVENAFDPHTHYPRAVSDQNRKRFGGPVGFIGQYEAERASSMYHLARAGIPVRVWGTNWGKCRYKQENLILEHEALWADDYAMAICAFDINLCFLRKANRDLQTIRSIEIPACGAFMLAERTEEHLALFEEGKEAEFFSLDEELLDKVRYYVAHEDARRRIAAAGRERCLKSGYSNHDRLRKVLEYLQLKKRF